MIALSLSGSLARRMKTTHRWLEEFCPHGKSAEAVTGLLRGLGHEIAGLQPLPEGDALLELEITANRPDCLSALGLAYELAAATGTPVRLPAAHPWEAAASGEPTAVAVAEPTACPFYTARVIRGVKVGPSPAWLARRLEAIGLAPISNVVDVTNYVLHETGQPLHAFDADRLKGGIQVRRARKGERLRTLDGVDRALPEGTLVIADAERPVALAGVMGGAETAVSAATHNVLLESALFDPGLIRRAARDLKLGSDSAYRFERGVDPGGVLRGSHRAAALIAALAGGTPGPVAQAGALPPAPKPFRLRRARLAALLGMEIPAAEVARILEGLGCRVVAEPDGWALTPPTRRARDLGTEAEASEEVARVWGYDRIPGLLALPARMGWPDPARRLAARLSERLRAAGFSEAVTTSFVDARAGGMRVAGAATGAAALALMNPMSSEQTHLRQSLLPGLLSALAANQSVGEAGGRFFELGRIHQAPSRETWSLALAGEVELRVLKGALESLGFAMEVVPGEASDPFAPGSGLSLRRGAEPVGAGGVLADAWACAYGLRRAPAVAELRLEPFLEAAGAVRRFRALPRFPAVERDLAVVVDEDVSWARIEAAARSVPCDFREALSFFDLYRGKQAGAGRKSLAFSIRFRRPDRTLTGEEVDAVMAGTIAALARDCGATVRR